MCVGSTYRTDLGLSGLGSNLTVLAPGGTGKGYPASPLPFQALLDLAWNTGQQLTARKSHVASVFCWASSDLIEKFFMFELDSK